MYLNAIDCVVAELRAPDTVVMRSWSAIPVRRAVHCRSKDSHDWDGLIAGKIFPLPSGAADYASKSSNDRQNGKLCRSF